MKQAGQIVLFRFPQTNLERGKLRPAVVLGKLPGEFDDWLVCPISSQTRHWVPDFDEIVREGDADFAGSGLRLISVIRIGHLAVVDGDILLGAIGQIAPERLNRIRTRLARWFEGL